VYTVTAINRAPNRTGALDFITFLLGPSGKHILKKNGFNMISPPKIAGDRTAIPNALRSVLGTG
jgi:molybdate/tungstate transport system substrate-binding protein